MIKYTKDVKIIKFHGKPTEKISVIVCKGDTKSLSMYNHIDIKINKIEKLKIFLIKLIKNLFVDC